MSFTRFGARSPETERRRTWSAVEASGAGAAGRLSLVCAGKASDHHGAELRGVDVVRRNGSHDAAEAEHRDSIGNRQNIFQLVADKDDADPLAREVAENLPELLHLFSRKKRRWLVENEDAWASDQRLDKFDVLLFADGEPFDLDGAVERQAVPP